MRGQTGFFDVDDRMKRLSDLGDQLETFRPVVDFEMYRLELNAALAYSDGSQGGRPSSTRSKRSVGTSANSFGSPRISNLSTARAPRAPSEMTGTLDRRLQMR